MDFALVRSVADALGGLQEALNDGLALQIRSTDRQDPLNAKAMPIAPRRDASV